MLETVNPRAAAADVGSESIHVSIGGAKPVVFGTVTRELQRLRDYLLAQNVDTIAMEFTGVYWMPLFEILEKTSIKVCLYNGAQIKALPGRKSDVADSQWASTLHSYGLIRSGFVPAGEIRKLRDYMRLRGNHLSQASSHVLQMQKALELMNLKIHDVISDITGASGQRLLRAILQGVRDPEVLVQCCDERILDKKEQRLRDSLEGTWAEQHLFALQQTWEAWEFCQRQISSCDVQIQKVLMEMTSKARAATPSDPGNDGEPQDSKEGEGKRKRMGKNAPKILELDTMLQSILGGRSPAKLPGLTQYTVLQLVSEIGTDLSAFPTEKHFTSWLGLAPGQRQSGKRRRNQSRKGARAGQIFRNVAQTVGRSVKMGLGVFYRRLRGSRGGLVACKALGRKLAELYYRVMTKGLKFVEEGLEKAEERFQEQARARLERQARKMGMSLQPLPS